MSKSLINSRLVTVESYQFFVNESGIDQSPKVLFLHGSGPGVTALSNWEKVMADLSGTFHCIAPDILGFADSSHPDPAPLRGDFMQLRVDTIVKLLDVMGISQVDLVGNSMGGAIAQRLAEQYPDRVRRLVLMGTALGRPRMTEGLKAVGTYYDDPTVENLTTLLSWFVYEPEQYGEKLRKIAEERIPRANREDVRRSHLASFSRTGPAESEVNPENIKQPTLVIHGRDDRILELQDGIDLFKSLPNAQAHFFGRCGHWAQIEQSERFVRLVKEFFQEN